jgi:hypothetical protein
MTGEPNEILIEQAVSAYRERDASGRIMPSPAWWDLTPELREELFRRQLESRIIERALTPDGMSTTVRSVLDRLRLG